MSAIVRWGLLIGLVMTALDLVTNLAMRPMLAPLAANPSPEALAGSAGPMMAFSCVALLASIVLYFVAGNRAAAETGRARDGVLAGLLAGAVSGVAGLVVEAVYPMPQIQVPGAGAPASQWTTTLIGLGVGLIIAAVVAALGAWWATRNREVTAV